MYCHDGLVLLSAEIEVMLVKLYLLDLPMVEGACAGDVSGYSVYVFFEKIRPHMLCGLIQVMN
ncbi:MAG: hypothetical protein IME93_00685 [Proteobacteria bacterium]|nr:hypothetical protein [Pseudomonadota bacterium]